MMLVNFQCRGVLLIWITVRQEPTALAVSAGGYFLDIFPPTIISHFFLSLSRRRLDTDCNTVSEGPKQPTNPLRIYFKSQ